MKDSDDVVVRADAMLLGANDVTLNWVPVSCPPPEKYGWFLGALSPRNHAEVTVAQINDWRRHCGFAKVWYNADAVNKWWEPDSHRTGSNPVDDRITHWSRLLGVPMLPEKEGET